MDGFSKEDIATITTFPHPQIYAWWYGNNCEIKARLKEETTARTRIDETGSISRTMMIRMNSKEDACLTATYCLRMTTEA